MRKENKYAIAFDAYKNFREIRIMDDPNEPFTIGKDMTGGSIYVFTQKEFKKLIESAMRHITEPAEADPSENINLAIGDVGRVKDPCGGSTEGSLTGGSSPMQFSLSGLDNCVTTGDGGIYYVGDLFDKGNGKGNGKQ